MHSLPKYPKARQADLILQRVSSEVVIYDLRIDRAIHLNEQLTRVWNRSDGQSSIQDIADSIAADTGDSVTVEIVELALEQLAERELLLEVERVDEDESASMSRREMLQKACVASLVMLPALSAITVPTPTSAASGAACPGLGNDPDCCPCTANGNCASGCCAPAPVGCITPGPGALPNGDPCRANCNCATGCCAPAPVGCVALNSLPAGQPCRADCNCISNDCAMGTCQP